MTIRVVERPNRLWRVFNADQAVTAVASGGIARDARFFVMGSCFAEEIRLAMADALGPGAVGPNYAALDFDPARVQVDELPTRNHLNTYNPLSVVQEIQRVLGKWAPEPEDHWTLPDGRVQCPYRRMVLAPDAGELARVTAGLDAVIRKGFERADHFVFTFGMAEVFLNRRSGKAACQKPGYGGGGGKAQTIYGELSFTDCLNAFHLLARLIRNAKPNARIYVTVSPVPLKMTFSGQDIAVANTQSKATLRAALGEAVRKAPEMVYFPSYEAVMAEGPAAFGTDGRHVRRDLVRSITAAFLETQLCKPVPA